MKVLMELVLQDTFGEKYVTTYDFTYDMIDHYKIKGYGILIKE